VTNPGGRDAESRLLRPNRSQQTKLTKAQASLEYIFARFAAFWWLSSAFHPRPVVTFLYVQKCQTRLARPTTSTACPQMCVVRSSSPTTLSSLPGTLWAHPLTTSALCPSVLYRISMTMGRMLPKSIPTLNAQARRPTLSSRDSRKTPHSRSMAVNLSCESTHHVGF
jgi:hypothetical protein